MNEKTHLTITMSIIAIVTIGVLLTMILYPV